VSVAFIREADMLRGVPLAGWDGRFFHSDNMTFARWTIAANASDLHEHSHEQEEVWNVVGGSIALIVNGAEMTLEVGDAAVVPSNVPHAARVIGDAEVVVADFPLRKHLPGVTDS
jgi:quercetin dioxygenase-like cupin family protein